MKVTFAFLFLSTPLACLPQNPTLGLAVSLDVGIRPP